MQQSYIWHDRHNIPRPYHLSQLPVVELEITRGRARNTRRRIHAATYLMGAGSECDLVLGDPQFPDVHGYLLVRPQGVVVRHLGFEPELTVNGLPIRSALLTNNTRIRTGPFEFRIHIWPQAAQPATGSDRDIVQPDGLSDGLAQNSSGPSAADLRVFRGSDAPRLARLLPAAHGPAGPSATRRPAAWPHYSQLILSP